MNGDQAEDLAVRIISQPEPKRPRYNSIYRTVVLSTTGEQAIKLLAASDKRVIAYVQALDDDIILSDNVSDAKNSQGIRISKTNTSPWPIQDSGDVHIFCPSLAGATSRVVVSSVYVTMQ